MAGVSEYLKEAYITYSDEAKEKLLGVDPKIIETYTVVSRETAEAMAYGGAKAAGSNICVSADRHRGTGRWQPGCRWDLYTSDAP